MLEWVRSNTELISLAVNLCMLGVWAIYLQLFLGSLRRQARSNILINLGPEGRILVSNMSTEPIYIQKLSLSAQKTVSVTDIVSSKKEGFQTHQGPLSPASCYDMGKLSELLRNAELDGQECELKLIATYTSEDLPVAAKRRFQSKNSSWVPKDYQTIQVRKKSLRQQLRYELQT